MRKELLKLKANPRFKSSGFLMVGILVFGSIAVILIGVLVGSAIANVKLSIKLYDRERAFHISEAGVEYYRWHLAHVQSDYQDGTGAAGPYIHQIYDKLGNNVGKFSLTITPPPIGSTVVKIQSNGNVLTSSSTRKILTTLAIPSLAKYAVVANDVMRFGQGTEIFGPIHSNNGIRFDGLAHNVVTSAVSSYDDPDHTGGSEFGVHTHVNPPPGSGTNDTFRSNEAPPNSVPNRNDVFMAGRQFPVPAFDFAGITTDLASIKSQAQSSGRYFGASGALGYHIVLKTNGTFDLYKVKSLATVPNNNCVNSLNQTGWGTWSIKASNGQQFLNNYTYPTNGVIFLEDNVWVDGQVNNTRVTIAAGRFPDNPSTRPSITINDDLLYTTYTGNDVIALISQADVNVGMVSDDTLRIDAALIAQNGRVGRFYYNSNCSPYDSRSNITLFGMIATNQRYGFAYTDGTGYSIRNINYDSNLLYSPPPSFPLTSGQYSTISWEELK